LQHVLSFGREPRKRRQAFKTIPTKLFSAYDEIVNRIEQSDRDLAFRVMSWLFRAKTVLRMEELLEALVVEDGDRDLERDGMLEPSAVIECCKSLVIYDETSGFVRFAHKTVHDYIEANIHLLPPPVHLTDTCLTYLSFDVFQEACLDKKSTEKRIQQYRFSLYAAQFWGFHARESEESGDVQKAVVACFVSEGKRNAILQIAAYANSNGRNISFPTGQTSLHLLAEMGLAKTCSLLMERERYVLLNI
jgi:hypothetical protein